MGELLSLTIIYKYWLSESNIMNIIFLIFEYNNSVLPYVQQEQDKMNDELHKEEKMWKEKFKKHEVTISCF